MTRQQPPSASAAYWIWLDGHPPTGNELHRMHWGERSRSREDWKGRVYYASLERYKRSIIVPMKTASVRFTWAYRIQRKRDIDNIIAGVKPLLDGLVVVGFIPDDDASVVRSLAVDVVVGKQQREGVLIELSPFIPQGIQHE